ncbi:hypothetical protein [Roseinatronobacter alkalisoli]|uniref:Uncharacterized protein n=1 Tax=Roseinatronobacter alkalisoli TaxID=3028235 RepID=A0ABT5TFB7_9RHOB|nr:hypothetical protein [Roseinatronobacter sp. HJB301]MDD7973815.1 hypothetical protein [Roseinatronobacter sp. HJB301]
MTDPLSHLSRFPLLDAIFGRRSRRFGLGMEIPSGPLAYRSRHDPLPLSELETSVLLAVGTGVSGWSFGVPFGPDSPKQHAHYSVRFTGRTAPTAGGFGTPAMLFTDDTGTYIINTRDATPERMREYAGIKDDAERIIAATRAHTVKLSDKRLDLPSVPPHMLEPNLWMANTPGSTLFMPIADASEQMLALLTMAISNGNVIMDDTEDRMAGDLKPFIRAGLLNSEKRLPLSVLQQMAYEANVSECAFMAHNMVLTLQAMGLGGLYFNGLNRWSILGAFAAKGIQGFGFRFQHDDRWTLPNPVGLEGIYQGLCPPWFDDMHAAVAAFIARKFSKGGTYDPNAPGPWKEVASVKGTVTPYSDDFTACLGTVAQYVFETCGKFPGTFSTIVLPGFVQAVHLDLGFYDTHYRDGAYLNTHAHHMRRWHGE